MSCMDDYNITYLYYKTVMTSPDSSGYIWFIYYKNVYKIYLASTCCKVNDSLFLFFTSMPLSMGFIIWEIAEECQYIR